MRVKEPDVAKSKIKEIFKNVQSVHIYDFYEDQMTIVTFTSAKDAAAAVEAPGNIDLFRPVNVMGMEEYLEERGKLLKETKDKWESSDKKCEI